MFVRQVDDWVIEFPGVVLSAFQAYERTAMTTQHTPVLIACFKSHSTLASAN